jgi:hypothetical protein
MLTIFELCRATPEEGRRTLPGDEVIPHPIMSQTHALTIGVPPDQIGSGRGWSKWAVAVRAGIVTRKI